MRKFLFNCIILGIILIVASAFLEISLLYQTNTYSYKHQYIKSHSKDIHVLLMGNSHIEEGLIPDSIGSGVFNAAISGRTYIYDNALIKQYIPAIKNLKAVIMPLDYQYFYLGRETDNPKIHIQPIDLKRTYKCMHYKYMDVKADFWYWPEILNSKIKFIARYFYTPEQARGCDSLGYIKLKLSGRRSNWDLGALPKLIDSKRPIDKEKYDSLNNAYSSMAKVTLNKNVRFILVSTPLYKTYHQDMNKDVIQEVHDFAAKLEKEFPNVEYYDFSFDNRFVPEDFNDASHMSEFGAAKFSKIMKGIIENHAK